MSDVEFHTQVPDRLLHACRWLRKAAASAAQVRVTADEETLLLLDQRLWTFSSTDFVPHCFQDAPAQVLENTAIVLSPHLPAPTASAILLNLGSGVPAGFEQFARVIEIVSEDANDKQEARNRWKHYASMGCKLTNHSLPAKAPT
ncbi:MAG: DNA polymerase III subunit chi [Rhodoferax sp.]|uniref:DNA polymerase III subunit chi n=1 Tax=Rhodoferax sp. TaxID=50421 RepID=UPI0027348561|nr:DNA polymerase III subunit chi [Rhodoferax sp.]MDP2678994.1 DNA polymerase III subunit chi [Rhodoferax sp.]